MVVLYKSSLKEARTDFKFWLAPDDTLYEVHVSETHEGWLYDWSGEDYAYHDALEDGWIRVIGITHILYFNCSDYDNKKFKRIYNALQKNFKLGSYTDDIEVVDDRDNKRYGYYGRKMKPVLSEKKDESPVYWITPENELIKLKRFQEHEDYLHENTSIKSLDEALQLGWIRVLGNLSILWFNVYEYNNKLFKRIYTILQKNSELSSYSDDIRVGDDKDNKVYKYYGSKLKPVLSESIDQTNTPEFKKWFGNSKVVDSSGKPLIVYHGTNEKFNSFDPVGRENAWDADYPEGAIFFTDNKKQAKMYGSNIMEVYLRMNNPFYVDLLSDDKYSHLSPEQYIDNYFDWNEFHNRGAVIVKGKNKNGIYRVYVMSDDNRSIKSATANNRNFSTTSNNIYESHFKEKLLDGFASFLDKDPLNDSGRPEIHKAYIRQIESKAEYNAILKNAYEPRGIIANGKFYLATQDSFEVVHQEILNFLHKKRLVDFRDINYANEVDRFLTVQVKNKKVYIGESYHSEFKAMVRQGGGGLPKYQMVLDHLSVLENLGIPYEVKFI